MTIQRYFTGATMPPNDVGCHRSSAAVQAPVLQSVPHSGLQLDSAPGTQEPSPSHSPTQEKELQSGQHTWTVPSPAGQQR